MFNLPFKSLLVIFTCHTWRWRLLAPWWAVVELHQIKYYNITIFIFFFFIYIYLFIYFILVKAFETEKSFPRNF